MLPSGEQRVCSAWRGEESLESWEQGQWLGLVEGRASACSLVRLGIFSVCLSPTRGYVLTVGKPLPSALCFLSCEKSSDSAQAELCQI